VPCPSRRLSWRNPRLARGSFTAPARVRASLTLTIGCSLSETANTVSPFPSVSFAAWKLVALCLGGGRHPVNQLHACRTAPAPFACSAEARLPSWVAATWNSCSQQNTQQQDSYRSQDMNVCLVMIDPPLSLAAALGGSITLRCAGICRNTGARRVRYRGSHFQEAVQRHIGQVGILADHRGTPMASAFCCTVVRPRIRRQFPDFSLSRVPGSTGWSSTGRARFREPFRLRSGSCPG